MKDYHISLLLLVFILLVRCNTEINCPSFDEKINILTECFRAETLTNKSEEEISKIMSNCDNANFVLSVTVTTEQSEKEMDLSNNAVGVSIAVANPNATESQLAALLCAELLAGNLLVLLDPQVPISPLVDSDVKNCNCP